MKKYHVACHLLFFFWIVFLFSGCNGNAPESEPKIRRVESPQRLISTVPSITEILFDIGLGDRIVGDSKYTHYPLEAEKIEKIGDLYDVNWEQIVNMEPDLALVLVENEPFRMQAHKLGIETLLVDHLSMEGVLKSYDMIGERFGPEIMQTAQVRKATLEEKLQTLQTKAESLPPVRVLICIDRTRGSGRLQNMYVAGTNPYFQDAIHWAGGINVAESTGMPISTVSTEGVMAMNPDVIIDLMIGLEMTHQGNAAHEQKPAKADLIADWKTLGNAVNAVKTGRIYVFTEDFTTIPGPRTPLFVEKLMKALHGEDIEIFPGK